MSGPMSPVVMVGLVVSVLLLGVGALRGAMSVRLRWCSPRCARCRYDVSGAAIAAGVCPECGVGLAGEKAVLFARRAGDRWAVGWVAGLMVVALGAAAWAPGRAWWAAAGLGQGRGNGQAGGVGSEPDYAAMSVDELIDVAVAEGDARGPAWSALSNHMMRRRVTAEQATRAVRESLDQLHALREPDVWRGEWPSLAVLVEDAARDGLLDPEVAADAAMAALDATPVALGLDRVVAGRPMFVEVDSAGAIAFSERFAGYSMIWRLTEFTIDGQVPGGATSVGDETGPWFPDFDDGLPAGSHRVETKAEYVLVPDGNGVTRHMNREEFAALEGVMRRGTASSVAEVIVVEAGEPVVKLVTVPGLGEYVRRIVEPSEVKLLTLGRGRALATVSPGPGAKVDERVVLAFSVFIEFGEQRQLAGTCVVAPRERSRLGWGDVSAQLYGGEFRVDGIPAGIERVSVVLVPDAGLVIENGAVHEVWGEEVRFERVPVRWVDGPELPEGE